MRPGRPSDPLSPWEREAVAYIDGFRERVTREPPGAGAITGIERCVLVLDAPRVDIEGHWQVLEDETLAGRYDPHDALTRLSEHTRRLGDVRRAIAAGTLALPDIVDGPRVLEALHARLQAPWATPGCEPGCTRTVTNHVDVFDRWGRTVDTVATAPVERVRAELELCFRDYQERLRTGALHVLEAIAELEGRLLWIHPFPDGNGRTARTLSLVLLHGLGYAFMGWVGIEYPFTQMRAVDDAGWRAYRHYFLARAVVVTDYLSRTLYEDR